MCSKSMGPHIELTGKTDGRFRTKIAEPYPPAMCKLIADYISQYIGSSGPVACHRYRQYIVVADTKFTNLHNIAVQRHFDAPLCVGVFATVAMS